MQLVMEKVFEECRQLRGAGQLEYAHRGENAFANFERTGKDVDLSREKVLWVFAMKHRDGIASYLKGHTSQREDVRGRINDLIVYLVLLRGMLDETALDSVDFQDAEHSMIDIWTPRADTGQVSGYCR